MSTKKPGDSTAKSVTCTLGTGRRFTGTESPSTLQVCNFTYNQSKEARLSGVTPKKLVSLASRKSSLSLWREVPGIFLANRLY